MNCDRKLLCAASIIAALLMPIASWGKIGGGDITFRPDGAAGVVFSHDAHVGRAALKCKDCHNHLYTTVGGHQKSYMAEMIKGQSCGACHNGKRAFTVRATCERCHQ